MKHLNSDLKYLAVKKFPQGGSSLFGEDFGNKAKTAVDNIRALKGIQYKSHFSVMVAPRERQSPRPRAINPIGASFRHQKNQSSTGWARHNTRNSRETSLSSKHSPRTTQSRFSTCFKGPNLETGSCTTPEIQPPQQAQTGNAPSFLCYVSGKENPATCEELGSDNHRPMGPGINFRLPHWGAFTMLHPAFKDKFY